LRLRRKRRWLWRWGSGDFLRAQNW